MFELGLAILIEFFRVKLKLSHESVQLQGRSPSGLSQAIEKLLGVLEARSHTTQLSLSGNPHILVKNLLCRDAPPSWPL